MGYNTTVLILNDCFDQIQKHPEEFVAGINEAMRDGGSVSVGNCANPVQVMPTAHADQFRLYVSQANGMVELSPYSRRTLELMEQFPDLLQEYIDAARWQLNVLEEKLHD